ncbi:MAG: hypothetical protein QXV17_04340 [Candidatus Micrarchaeaceae archaeon]
MQGKVRGRSKALVMVGIFLLSSLMVSMSDSSYAAVTFPPSITHYAPIWINNSQTSATPSPFQTLINITASNYAGYLVYSGSQANFEFFYSNGTIIPAWIESNISGVIKVWVKTVSIGASSSLEIYLGFASTSTNFLSSSGTSGIGEAPQLSSPDNLYNDGSSVFNYFQNFGGLSALPTGWTNSGVTISYNSLNITITGTTSWENIYYDLSPSLPAVVEFYGNFYVTPSELGTSGAIYSLGTGTTGNYQLTLGDVNGSDALNLDGTTFVSSLPNNNAIYTLGLTTQTSDYAFYNYQHYYTHSPASATPTDLILAVYGTEHAYVYYVRERASPPNAIMPSVTAKSAEPTTQSITFTESGLPSGTIWYLNISGQSPLSSTGTSITTSLPSGTYNYTIATGNKIYKPSPSSGSFTVNGAPGSLSISFALVEYEITVSESGLPAGNWYFNVSTTSQDFTEPYSTATLHFNETNGTYSFTVQTNDKEYSPSPSSGSLIINGSAQTLSVPFTEVTYSVTFTETGLPSGTKWYVNITSGPSYSSTATTITLPEDNGTHSYTIATGDKIYDPSPYSGSFTINGAGASESITFNEITYSVTFTETGLPSGTKWYVNTTGGNSYSSTSTSLSFSAPNGTDSYTVATVNKIYYPTPSSSSFTVNGSSLSETVSFSEITYSVTFTETGLPSGTTWYVNLTGIGSYSSATSSLTFKDPNGTYDYTLSDNNNAYAPSPSSGSFTINGANLNVSVTFRPVKYNVTFKETGLPTGASWFAILNGSKTISNKTSISFLEFNGTYSYSVETPVNGSYGTRYVTVAPSKNVTVNGKAVTVNITYSTQYYLLISISPSNGGTVSPSSEWVSASHYVIINASADPSFIFQSWTGTGSGSYSGPFNPENITVRGPINETATFEKTYTITFTESGLPAGQKWYVNVSGPRSFYSYSTQISFAEPNGSYSYSIGVNRIYSAPQEAGTIVVQGSSVTESVTFSLVTYTVDFIEIGLPSGDTWSVSLNGTLSPPSTNQSISFSMPNGTYPYSIPPISGVVIEPDSGNVLVSGQNVVVNIVFSPQGNKGGVLVSFIETGLPTGKEWFVTLNGYVESSFSDLIQFYVQNGTYTYSISSSGGLKASPAFGNISVTHNMEVTVTFSNSTSSTTTVINPKVVEENLPLIIGSTIVSIIAGWLLSIYINPENRKKRAEKKRGKRR